VHYLESCLYNLAHFSVLTTVLDTNPKTYSPLNSPVYGAMCSRAFAGALRLEKKSGAISIIHNSQCCLARSAVNTPPPSQARAVFAHTSKFRLFLSVILPPRRTLVVSQSAQGSPAPARQRHRLYLSFLYARVYPVVSLISSVLTHRPRCRQYCCQLSQRSRSEPRHHGATTTSESSFHPSSKGVCGPCCQRREDGGHTPECGSLEVLRRICTYD
jgi:hypothetical protein